MNDVMFAIHVHTRGTIESFRSIMLEAWSSLYGNVCISILISSGEGRVAFVFCLQTRIEAEYLHKFLLPRWECQIAS